MEHRFVSLNIAKLKQQLCRVRFACLTAIELGDCRAVARLTCEAARLRDCLKLLDSSSRLKMA